MSVGSSLEAMNGIRMTMSECAPRVIKSAKEKIGNVVLKMEIKMKNILKKIKHVLPFGRHRRSLSKSIDFLLLSK
jgi:Cu/Ag efflux protein CusF